MDRLTIKDKDYRSWIKDVGERYRKCQIKAALSVNRERLRFYLLLGRDIVEMKAESRWGSGFYDTLSRDIRSLLSDATGFSARNLRYMVKFYAMYGSILNLPQAAANIENDPEEPNLPQFAAKIDEEELFSVPWGHHRVILDACKGDEEKAVFYIRKTIQNNWSRAVLGNFMETDLYGRQGKAISNFEYTLPSAQGDLAQEITKDPYNFDFLSIREDYNEKQLKDALMDNVISLLLELGRGFAFVGREYPLPIEGTEEYIDLLFYHLYLHCYVIVEVKVKEFSSKDIGQVGTYVAIADDLIRREEDSKTIGLIICKSKNNILAQYAVGTSKEPIGISAYELSNLLPTAEEIEEELRDIDGKT